MLSKIFAATVRHRRPILIVEVVGAVVVVAVDRSDWRPFLWMAGLGTLGLVLGLLALSRYRPAVLSVRADVPAFDTPVSPAPVYFFTAYLGIAVNNLSNSIESVSEHDDVWLLDVAVAALFVAVVVACFRAAWVGIGVRLRPDGLLDRGLLGSLFVPWDGFRREYPAWPTRRGQQVRLSYQGESRRRGLVPTGRRILNASNVDRDFLTRVIKHYVVHPEHRPAIGTAAEYDRLTQGSSSQDDLGRRQRA